MDGAAGKRPRWMRQEFPFPVHSASRQRKLLRLPDNGICDPAPPFEKTASGTMVEALTAPRHDVLCESRAAAQRGSLAGNDQAFQVLHLP